MEGRERQIPTPQNEREPTTPRYSEELDEHRSLKALVMLVQKVQCIKKKKKISQPEKYKGYSKKSNEQSQKKWRCLFLPQFCPMNMCLSKWYKLHSGSTNLIPRKLVQNRLHESIANSVFTRREQKQKLYMSVFSATTHISANLPTAKISSTALEDGRCSANTTC